MLVPGHNALTTPLGITLGPLKDSTTAPSSTFPSHPGNFAPLLSVWALHQVGKSESDHQQRRSQKAHFAVWSIILSQRQFIHPAVMEAYLWTDFIFFPVLSHQPTLMSFSAQISSSSEHLSFHSLLPLSCSYFLQFLLSDSQMTIPLHRTQHKTPKTSVMTWFLILAFLTHTPMMFSGWQHLQKRAM